jgi:hypothetical protein
MEAAGEFWVRKYDAPGHAAPLHGVFDPEGGAWFVWTREVLRPNPGYEGPRNHRPVDRDVHRLLIERMPPRRGPSKFTLNRIREVQANGYALLHYAGEAGMDPDEYLDSLIREVDDVFGYDVDLGEDEREDRRLWEEVIKPEVYRAARRGAWKGVGPIS